jgi:prevent-host-death family protein
MCYMVRIGVRELRQYASRYLARVVAGETVEVTQRGRPVARIVPARGDSWAELIASGEVTPAASGEDLLIEAPGDYGNLSGELDRLRADERG